MKLARRVLELAESATLAVSAKAARMKAEGIDVIGFGVGETDFPTHEHIKQAGVAAIRAGHTRYAKPASGIPAAKEAVCHKFARDNNLAYTPEQVMITAGGKMAVYLAIHAIVNPGDEVIIPKPYWVSYPEIVKLAGGIPVFVAGPANRDYKLAADDVARVLTPRTRVFLFNSPSNPSGVTYEPEELRAIAGVLQDRDVIVLSDEIYDQLGLAGQEVLSYATVSDKAYAQTLTINGASKTHSMTGWRLGYVAGPAPIVRGMAKLQSQSTSGAATFAQHALIEALRGDQAPVAAMRAELEIRARHMHARLTAMEGVCCPRPTGAFYCFPNVSACYDKLGVGGSVEFADRLLEKERVAVVPGVAFGLDEHVRVSFAMSTGDADIGLDRLERFLRP